MLSAEFWIMFAQGLWETVYVTVLSTLFAYIIGLPLGLLLAVTDAAIAAQNAVVAAESLGIGSCYIGDVMENCERQRELLHLPDYVFPAAMLVFGWPTRQQRERPKPARCPMEQIVHTNAYRCMDGQELRAMLAGRTGAQGFEDWCAAFCARKYDSDFSREMTRSVEEYLHQFMRGK